MSYFLFYNKVYEVKKEVEVKGKTYVIQNKEDYVKLVHELAIQGYTLSQIAKLLNISEKKVLSYMQECWWFKMGNLYLLNSPIIPTKKNIVVAIRNISLDDAKKLVQNQKFISAIGHDVTAKLLSMLLGVEVPINRIQIYFDEGDEAIVFTLKQRLAEGQVLKTIEEIEKIGYELKLIKVLTGFTYVYSSS